MNRKVLISFLGTAPYLKSSYYLGEKAENEPAENYVQSSIFREVCKNWSAEDLCLILTTGEAEAENWKKCKKYPDEYSLEVSLQSYGYKAEIRNLNIKTGQNINEIYEIFNAIFNELTPHDEVHFDITNSFRYLPMLGFVLFNYARTVQNISIKKIYYGAFETLGDPREIEKNYPNAEDRKVPIFDLTSFVTLQDWANISNEFINLGESQNFEKISGKNSDLALQLDDLVKSIRTSRGGKLVYGFDFEGLQQKIKAAKNEESPNQQQMERLLSKIEEKVNHFKNDDIINGFHAVKWCIDYQLIPQGYTLLQETVRTWLLIKMGYAKKKITDYKFRSMADIALNDIPKWKMDEATGEYITNKNGHRILKWRGVQRYERDKIEEIERMIQYVAQFKGLIEQFARITGSGLRNDINHGGFNDDPASPEDLKNELQDLYTKIKNILKL